MTSSGTSTDVDEGTTAGRAATGRALRLAVLAVAIAALIAGCAFILWHHQLRLTAAAVVLMLGWGAVLSSVYFLWRTADNADLDDQEDWWRPAGRVEELGREKRSLLKAIKETEMDRDTGKLSAEDAADLIGRCRARAIEVIKAIEEAEGGAGDVRDRIEREVRARLAIDRGDRKGKRGSAGAGDGTNEATTAATSEEPS
jgi:hypothetical protein